MIITSGDVVVEVPQTPVPTVDVTVSLADAITMNIGGTPDEFGSVWYLGGHPLAQSPSMRSEVSERFGDDGVSDFTQFFDQWQFELVGTAIGTPESLRRSQAALLASLGRGLKSLRVVEPTWDRWLSVRRDGGISWAYHSGHYSGQCVAQFQIPLSAPDPRLYSTTPRTLEAPLPGVGSPPVPHAVPHAMSAGAVTVSATNAGTETAWPVWRLVGPWEGLRLSNPATGEFMEFRMSLGAGEWLQVTTAPRGSGRGTVLLMGDRDLSRRRDMVGGYWGFEPGQTQVVVTGKSPLVGINQVFATHNDVWV